MTRISPYALWIGHARDGASSEQLANQGIEALVHVAEEDLPVRPLRDLTYCRIPLVDGTGNAPALLDLAITTVARLLQAGVPTIVCCSNGLSRSPAIAAAALSRAHGNHPEDCLKLVLQHHPSDVSPGFWNEITRVLTEHAAPRQAQEDIDGTQREPQDRP